VVTGAASSVDTASATISGIVNSNGLNTTYYFEYGTTTSYGSPTSAVSAGSGTSSVSVSASISGLAADTTYHFRIVATGSGSTPAATRPSTPCLSAPPAPVMRWNSKARSLGQAPTANAGPQSPSPTWTGWRFRLAPILSSRPPPSM